MDGMSGAGTDHEIRKEIARRVGELSDRLEMKSSAIAETLNLPSKHPSALRTGKITPTAPTLYRLHDLARNQAWLLPDFFGSQLEPYPDYALSRAATQFLNAPWIEWLERDVEIDTIGKEGKYQRAPFRFAEAMQTLVERFPPKNGRFEMDNHSLAGHPLSRNGPGIQLNIRFDRAGFLSMRKNVQDAGLTAYPLALDNVLVGQTEGDTGDHAIREHFAQRMGEYQERLGVTWHEMSAVAGVNSAKRWTTGEIRPDTVKLQRLHHFAREEAGLFTDFFDVRLEPDPTYTTRRAIEFLQQNDFDLGQDPVAMLYQRMPVGIYEGLRELTRRFPAGDGICEIIGPEEESGYDRNGIHVEATLHLDADGLASQRRAGEAMDTFAWHAAGVDRTPSTQIEFASHSIQHLMMMRVRDWK